MKLNRGVSNLVATLIVIALTISVAFFTSLVVSNLMRQSEPKGSILTIQGVRAIPLRSDYSRMMIEVIATVHGTNAIRYDGASAYNPDGQLMTPCTLETPNTSLTYNPGQTFTVTITCSTTGGQWANRQVVVEVWYIDVATNRRQLARGTGTILPYS